MKFNMTALEIDAALKDPERYALSDLALRDIDDRIWRWVNENKLNPAAPGWQYDLFAAPRYTTSVDDALTLRPVFDTPDGPQAADYVLEHVNGGLTIGCRVASVDDEHMRFGDNDAQAIVRACLEAHGRIPGSLPLRQTPLRDA